MAKQFEADKKQTFRFTAPGATSVLLVGDFTNWQQKPVPMQKGKDGIWIARLDLIPGQHRYRFIVDGEWRDDPDCTLRVPNAYGTENMVRQVT